MTLSKKERLPPLIIGDKPPGRFPPPRPLCGKGVYPPAETTSLAFLQLALCRLDPSVRSCNSLNLTCWSRMSLAAQTHQATVPGVQEGRQYLYGRAVRLWLSAQSANDRLGVLLEDA